MADAPWRNPQTLRRLYWDEGLSLDAIADRLGCSDVTVLNWMEKHDIQRRTEKRKRLPRPLTVTSPGSMRLLAGRSITEAASPGTTDRRTSQSSTRTNTVDSTHRNRRPNITSRRPSAPRRSARTAARRSCRSAPTGGRPAVHRRSRRRESSKSWTASSSAMATCTFQALSDRDISRSEWRTGSSSGGSTINSTGARLYREATDIRRTVYSLRTRSLDWFDRYRDWYRDGAAWIPPDYSLSRAAARMWYVSDGSACWNGDSFCSVRIAGRRLAAEQPDRFVGRFEALGYDARITPRGLRFYHDDGQRFLDWIGPAVPGFAYNWETRSRARSRRLKP